MNNRLFFILFFLCFHFFAQATSNTKKVKYSLRDDPIDVVFVSHPKDQRTLDYCIDGILENCGKVRRVIVVSDTKLTDKAEWFDEKDFPFSKNDIALTIGRGSLKKSEEFFKRTGRGVGWYYQQLLKLYSPLVIPGISSNVLVVDADTIFMNPVEFLNDSFGGLFCTNPHPAKETYIKHAKSLVPGYKRIYPEVYSVCHHMLFQRAILQDLFEVVEEYHKKKFWMAFCLCVDTGAQKKGASEYEIYYNYALRHTDQVALRELKWANSGLLENRENFKKQGYHFVSFHTYMKGKNKTK